ncbi:UbiH/UbiF/VisC/COQ6 family ubiquinone biosynthesis hydroxylase [Vreelandella malpeensis]|uniref:UbiH/UbiF/VisC/COQ6 family ubiquinone biosynthesis hydroxylase n=1 Tax=Vreelandella malpeensis TaxID=1172368 RepID=A0ABS8DWF3_9GAMM|nr:UbiH/UbiF/VisC/COQ6 family ubiquinone biosynthesis hydroxylase [Halomonas malpeensis]MCB8890667.1 UbiH/UbiF/VisC/COQ6 family ubiquinone biosynthesis hydroxylase [Halomonas malpeensis]
MQTPKASPNGSFERFDVVIVGAGMVGAALAGLLAGAGMRTALVEAAAAPLDLASLDLAKPAARVSALTPVSQRLLTHLGAWPAMERTRITPYRYMQVWDGEGSGSIDFSAFDAGTSVLGHIVENDVTLAALNHQVLVLPHLHAMFGAKVATLQSAARGRCLVLEDGRELHAPLVVAADGAHSTLRALAGIEVSEEAMEQDAVVTTVRCERPHGGAARQVFIDGRPLAFLPLTVEGDDRYCSIVWSTTPEHARLLSGLSREALGETLGEAFGHRLGRVDVCDVAYRFPLVQRHASTYVLDHFALVGDAAHTIHPLAGQGVNLGLMDAAVLADEVVRAWRRGAPWGERATLDRFERRRRLDNAAMLALMKAFKELFGSRSPALTLARNLGMSAMSRATPLKRLIIRQATGERGRLPPTCR